MISQLIAHARQEKTGLGKLLERYRPFLLLKARREIGPKLAARSSPSDVVQETMMEATRAFEGFRGQSEPEFSAWINQIHDRNMAEAARKHVHAAKRAVAKEQRMDQGDASATISWWEPAADQSSPTQRLIRGERALRLARALEKLPEKQRRVVCLRHIEGWSLDKIAEELGRSAAATAGLVKRGLQALREDMSQESWE
jgi:RNA polymerase sigma-70 factor, ECF subfamily